MRVTGCTKFTGPRDLARPGMRRAGQGDDAPSGPGGRFVSRSVHADDFGQPTFVTLLKPEKDTTEPFTFFTVNTTLPLLAFRMSITLPLPLC